jgi:hypothetical protein
MKIMSILLNKSFQIPLKGQGEIFLRILVILMVLSLKVNYDYAVKKLFNFVSLKISHTNNVFTKIVKDSFFCA